MENHNFYVFLHSWPVAFVCSKVDLNLSKHEYVYNVHTFSCRAIGRSKNSRGRGAIISLKNFEGEGFTSIPVIVPRNLLLPFKI